MAQQTAVEWLFNELDSILELYPSEWEKVSIAIQQAKEMEKEQIINAHDNGKNILPPNENGEQYYNETYKTK